MANEVSLVVKVSEIGLKGLLKQAEEFNKNMQAGATAGGTTGSKNAAAAAYQAQNKEYNLGRSIGSGSTGSATSDFAAQARGLGGLVHLYATFAANIFAAEAAFRALSDAVNTQHLATGLDQLSAQSGKALGTLAKQLNLATDGALSMKEAMASTANASAAGMSNKQILEMGEVAKKASQALGWDMADAMDRLTKGISKNRPQLLDELGILVNANTIYTEYARTVGKSTTALTDFEKKQAFANAVLKQGLDKFSAIDIPTNPYTKLIASMKDMAQVGLTLINTVLTPIIGVLASSPTALATAMGLIGLTLVKQAIPALGAWREGLNRAASDSAATAKRIHDSFEEYDIGRKLNIGGAIAKQATQAANEAISGVQTALGKAFTGKSSLLTSAMSGTYDAKEFQAKIDAQVKGNTTILNNLKAQRDLIAATDLEHLAAMDADIEKQAMKLGQLKQASMYNKIAATEQAAAATALQIAENKAAMDPGVGSEAWQRKQIADRAARAARSNAIMANVGSNTETMGAAGAFRELHDDIKNGTKVFDDAGVLTGRLNDKLGILGKGAAYAGGTIRILGSTLATAFTAFLPYIGVALLAFEGLSLILSKNSEEVKKYNESLDTVTTATKVATDVSKQYGDSITISSVTARANALDTLASSVTDLTTNLEAADAKASWFDKLLDVKGMGTDLQSKFAAKMGDAISHGLDAINDPKLKKEAEDKLKDLLNVSTLDPKSISDAYNKIDSSKVVALGKASAALLSSLKERGAPAASALTDIKDGFKDLDTKFQELSNTLINNDSLSKFGATLASQSLKMAGAFKDPIESVATLNAILKDTSLIKMFPPAAQNSIMDAAAQIQSAYKGIEDSQKAVYDAQNKIDSITKSLNDPNTSQATKEIMIKVKIEGETQLAMANASLDSANAKMNNIQNSLAGAVTASMQASIRMIAQPLTDALAKGSIEIQKTLLDKLPKTVQSAQYGTALEQQSLRLQASQITSTYDLIKELEASRLSAERLALEKKKEGLNLTSKQGQEELVNLNGQIDSIKLIEKSLKSKTLTKDVKSGVYGPLNELPPEVLKLMQQESNVRAKLAELSTKEETTRINGLVSIVEAAIDTAKQGMESDVALLEKKKTELTSSKEFISSTSTEEQRKKIDDLDTQISTYTKAIAMLPGFKEAQISTVVANEAGKGTKLQGIAKEDITIGGIKASAAGTQADLAKSAADNAKEQARAIEDINTKATKANSTAVKGNLIATRSLDLATDLTQASLDALEIENSRGRLTVDDYNQRKQILSLTLIENDRQKQLNSAELAHQQALRTYDVAKATGSIDQKAQAAIDVENENYAYQSLTESINRATEAKKAQAKTTTLQTSAEIALEDGINSAADSLSGAFFDATQSGKYDFSDMINSMLMDLAKLEFKMAMMNLYKQAVGTGGILGLLGIGGSSGMGAPNAGPQPPVVQAKGGVWEQGVQAFAKGGTFTNSVVDSPTVFKFAKGTGIMGEAGPEAIMPLQRDSNGRLGVANHDGGSVTTTQVVVNNYSGASAEAKETLDSRGQRKIEVTIGNMVAGEIQRSGSAAQQSIKNTFGKQPALIRR